MDCGKTRLCVEKNNSYFEIIRELNKEMLQNDYRGDCAGVKKVK